MFSIQLWSTRGAVQSEGWEPVLGRLAAMGFPAVEPFALHAVADEIAPIVASLGLSVPTAHGFLTADLLDETLEAAHRLGVKRVYHPHFDGAHWGSDSALDATVETLSAAARRASQWGIEVGFHNHDEELRPLVEGGGFWQLMERLPPEIGVEFDVYWAAMQSRDIAADLRTLGSRVTALHVKDGPFGGVAEDQSALGTGALPLDAALAAAPQALPVLSLDRFAGGPDAIWEAIERSQQWLAARDRAQVPA